MKKCVQVILLKKVFNIGNVGDVITVTSGYARNYLFPKRIAIRATKDNKMIFEQKKSAIFEKIDVDFEKRTKLIISKIGCDPIIKIAKYAAKNGNKHLH